MGVRRSAEAAELQRARVTMAAAGGTGARWSADGIRTVVTRLPIVASRYREHVRKALHVASWCHVALIDNPLTGRLEQPSGGPGSASQVVASPPMHLTATR